MKFLIQTIDDKVKHDFSFTLMESCEYQNWLRNNKAMKYCFGKLEDKANIWVANNEYVPIGSVEFVTKFLQDYYGLTPKPRNIPVELMTQRHLHRTVINGTEKDIIGKKFVKSNDGIKLFTEYCESAPPGNYQISDIIDIKSEWRGFVYKRKLVGLQNYSGDFDVFPDVNAIRSMIEDYSIFSPIAYTLDVAVTEYDKTAIIEVHDFFSCGLYGFADHRILPFMFIDWFKEYTTR